MSHFLHFFAVRANPAWEQRKWLYKYLPVGVVGARGRGLCFRPFLAWMTCLKSAVWNRSASRFALASRESMKRQALLAVAVLLPAAWAAILGPVPAAGPAALARVPPPILGRFWEPKPGERRQAVERILEVEVRMFFSPHPRALARSLTLTIFPPYLLRSWSG